MENPYSKKKKKKKHPTRFKSLPTPPPSQNPRLLPKSNHCNSVICLDLSLCIYACIIYTNIIGFGVCFLFLTQKISLYMFLSTFLFSLISVLEIFQHLCIYIFLILLNCYTAFP